MKRSPSSIFSFETLDLSGFRPWAVVVCLGVLVAIEVGIARQDWVWKRLPRSDAGIIDALERKVIHKAGPLDVVILGNSRTRDAIPPRSLEAELGLAEGKVLNASLTEGSLFDSAMMYRRNRDQFKEARLLLVGIDLWNLQLNDEPGTRERRFTPLEYRWSAYRGKNRADMLINWAWRSYDYPWVETILDPSKKESKKLAIDEQGRVAWRDGDDPEFGPETIDVADEIEGRYAEFQFSETELDCLRQLVNMAREDGLDVVIVRPPLRNVFIDARDAVRPHIEDQFRQRLEEFVSEFDHVYLVIDERASDCGLKEVDFLDYGHMTAHGAEIYTTRLAQDLRVSGATASLGID